MYKHYNTEIKNGNHPSIITLNNDEIKEIIDNKKYTYHDTYFGGIKFMGKKVVYCDNSKPIWRMNYYGIIYDDTGEGTSRR